ncbi:hypothetical protein F4861DRAFT_497977 [Xylaria intraflava]|nr:hypothetical protein F4861DRAFT_497977 [Xylaria intraflava]
MNEALCSILCSEEDWYFHFNESIRFNKDGTGELICWSNLHYWFLVELEWKSIRSPDNKADRTTPPSPSRPITTRTGSDKAEFLGQLDLEITLTRRMAGRARRQKASNTTLEEASRYLGDDALRTKSYTVRIERGNFIIPAFAGNGFPNQQRYSLRLLFDRSPYPPYSEWVNPPGEPEDGLYGEQVEFVARSAPDSARQHPPMNDPSAWSWNSCVVS